MPDRDADETMNTMTTTLTASAQSTDLLQKTNPRLEESDNESFHSAITSAPRTTIHGRSCPAQTRKGRTYMIKHDTMQKSDSRSGPAAKLSDDQSTEDDALRPSSRRSSKTSPAVPKRRSSLGRKRRASLRKQDSTALHRQSCQIFSSLDGVLALSRDITPLPSVSSSRSVTRHPSLIPEDATLYTANAQAQMYEKLLDAKLAYTYSYSYSLNTDSTASIPLPPSQAETHPRSDSFVRREDATSHRTPRGSVESQNDSHTHDLTRPPFNTIMSWTSDATRRREYAAIDRATTGLRGFVRRVVPRCLLSRNGRRGFFTGKCEGDSVRRFRMDVNDDQEEDGPRAAEKVSPPQPVQAEAQSEAPPPPPATETGGETGVQERTPGRGKWSCFGM